jgi:hypothetical protein
VIADSRRAPQSALPVPAAHKCPGAERPLRSQRWRPNFRKAPVSDLTYAGDPLPQGYQKMQRTATCSMRTAIDHHAERTVPRALL